MGALAIQYESLLTPILISDGLAGYKPVGHFCSFPPQMLWGTRALWQGLLYPLGQATGSYGRRSGLLNNAWTKRIGDPANRINFYTHPGQLLIYLL